jgi:hypothetical protein
LALLTAENLLTACLVEKLEEDTRIRDRLKLGMVASKEQDKQLTPS